MIYAIIGDGKQKLRLEGRIEPDGVFLGRNGKAWSPVALGAHCQAHGVDPAAAMAGKAPREFLAHLGMNPGGVEVVAADEWDARCRVAAIDARAARDADIEAAIPGALEILALANQVASDREDDHEAFARMMEDEQDDGARPPRRRSDPERARRLAELLAANPRAALYLRAVRQAEGAHWADNSGAGGGGKAAMQLLESGASEADAEAALAFRRPFVD